MKTVRLFFGFAGAVLPVVGPVNGKEMVPLKPISDLFGLVWESQCTKVRQEWYAKRLGTEVLTVSRVDQQRAMTCIRQDRIVTYLNTLNPVKVRAAGNHLGADYLEEKQIYWDEQGNSKEHALPGIFSRDIAEDLTPHDMEVENFFEIMKLFYLVQEKPFKRTLRQMANVLAQELGESHFIAIAEAMEEEITETA